MREIERIHPKYLIISAEFLSDLGNQFVQLTLINLLIFKGENALTNLLFLCMIEQTPSILLSPFAGLWIDRIGGRKWLIVVSLIRSLLVGSLAFILDLWVIFPVYLCLIIGSLFFHIGRLSLTPILIPKDGLIPFNSLNERVSLFGRIFGPWFIGLIILNTGQRVALGLAGFLFALSVCTTYRLPKTVQPAQRTHSLQNRKGLTSLLLNYMESVQGNHHLKAYFIIFGFILLGGGILNLGLLIFFKSHFGSNIADWGLILSGFQAGSCLATFLLPRCSSTFRHQTILAFTFLILGGTMAILGLVTTYIQIALLMILFGCGFTLIHIFLESLIQQNSPMAHMGKTISLLTTYRGACYLGTILCSALVIRIWGPIPLLLTGSLIMISASLLCSFRIKLSVVH